MNATEILSYHILLQKIVDSFQNPQRSKFRASHQLILKLQEHKIAMTLYIDLELLQKYLSISFATFSVLLFAVVLLLCYLHCRLYGRNVSKREKIIAFEDEEPPSYDEAMNTRELEPPTYAQAQFMFESVM